MLHAARKITELSGIQMSDEQMNDSTFGRLFIIMIIAMTILTIIIVVLASFAASGVNAKLDERAEVENTQTTADRIAPIGVFSATTVAAAPVVAKALTVEEVYASCSACHASGAAGAPITGEAGAWSGRIAKGVDTLYLNAINGINAMPAKGGNASLSDENVKAAVDYMLNQSK